MADLMTVLGQLTGQANTQIQEGNKQADAINENSKQSAINVLSKLTSSFQQGYAQGQPTNQNGPLVTNMNSAQADNTVAASNPNQALDPFTAYQQSAADRELKSRFSKDAENMPNDMLLHYATKTDTQQDQTSVNNNQNPNSNDTTSNVSQGSTLHNNDLLSQIININPTDTKGNPKELGLVPNILQFLASGKFANASEQMGAAKVFQEIVGGAPMQKGEKERLATEALYQTPNMIRETQKAAAENLPAQRALLNRGERINMMFTGNLPKSLQGTRQILEGRNPKTGNSLMQESMNTRLQKISETLNVGSQHTDAQIATYNRLRSKGMSMQEATKKAGL